MGDRMALAAGWNESAAESGHLPESILPNDKD